MGYVVKRQPWITMEYPKFRFFILHLLGAHEYVKQAKQQIDAINHLREKEWIDSKPAPPPPQGLALYPSANNWPRPAGRVMKEGRAPKKRIIEVRVDNLSRKEAMRELESVRELIEYGVKVNEVIERPKRPGIHIVKG